MLFSLFSCLPGSRLYGKTVYEKRVVVIAQTRRCARVQSLCRRGEVILARDRSSMLPREYALPPVRQIEKA